MVKSSLATNGWILFYVIYLVIQTCIDYYVMDCVCAFVFKMQYHQSTPTRTATALSLSLRLSVSDSDSLTRDSVSDCLSLCMTKPVSLRRVRDSGRLCLKVQAWSTGALCVHGGRRIVSQANTNYPLCREVELNFSFDANLFSPQNCILIIDSTK